MPASSSIAWPLALLFAILIAQFSLIFIKSFNWDEFLHYNMVYQLREGTLARPFQTLLARALIWAPHYSDDLLAQMTAARMLIWSVFAGGLLALYGLARRFVARVDALWTVLLYLSSMNVFAHGFAIRTDPIAMTLLMLGLYCLATRPLRWTVALGVGTLVGFSSILTVKSIFCAPCFVGLAWLRLSEAENKPKALVLLASIVPAAGATFAAIYLAHRSGLAEVPTARDGASFLANSLNWLTEGLLPQPRQTFLAIVTAPMFVLALLKAPFSWRARGVRSAEVIALVGLCLPLVVILFYRNVFPYFFVFILAPAAVALAPAAADLRKRYGTFLFGAAIAAIPLYKLATEPREVLSRQRAVIDYVHNQFPKPVLTLDYSGIVADYPRVVDHLLSGVGRANYDKRGVPLVAQAIARGELGVAIENHDEVALAMAGRDVPGGLLPDDVAALREHFARAWGPVWLAGQAIPAGDGAFAFEIPRAGSYVAADEMILDGTRYRTGDVAKLGKGFHVVTSRRLKETVLWRGDRLPADPGVEPGQLYSDF